VISGADPTAAIRAGQRLHVDDQARPIREDHDPNTTGKSERTVVEGESPGR
jgi:hypothetical protein